MLTIPQRLSKIFATLLESGEPVSVTTLAAVLGVSRRTVFRELENVDGVLKKLNLRLETTVGEGLYLFGEQSDIDRLQSIITEQRDSLAVDKEKRRTVLALLILDSIQWEKLYYFSSVLEVSEATVSLDMDIIERDLRAYNIQLLRKKGMGVLINGTEMNVRTAFVNYLLKVQNSFLPEDVLSATITQGVNNIVKSQSIFLNWMTGDAITIMSYRLIVQISRLKKGQTLGDCEVKKQSTLYTEVARKLAQELSFHFNVEISEQEFDYIVDGLRAARTKTKSEFYEDENISFSRAEHLAYKMIEHFDASLAPSLKTNDELVRGLSIHLWSAVVRIENGYHIEDPLEGQLKKEYPDIYQKAERACTVLSEELQRQVPEEEIACVATHFGAAVMQIGGNRVRRRLKASVICLGGIGVSYMMAGQVKKFFGKEVITEVGEYNQPYSWKNSDFLIATTNIPDTDKPVIIAHPLLTTSEINEIRQLIEVLSTKAPTGPEQEKVTSFVEQLNIAIYHLQDLEVILRNFKKVDIQPDMDIEELSRFVSYRFVDSPSDSEKVYNSLISREQMSSQLIEQLELVLLHCSTDGIKKPLVMLLHPSDGHIFNAQGKRARSCLLIMIPKNSSPELKETIGAISGALVEDEQLLSAVVSGDFATAYKKIEFIFSTRLTEFHNDLLGG